MSRSSGKKIDVLFIIAILLLIAGGVLLLVEPIRTYRRTKKAQEGLQAVEAQISENIVAQMTTGDNTDEVPMVTFVVSRDDNPVSGEEFDYFTDDEEERASLSRQLEEDINNLPEYVTLNAIGILKVESANILIPVWDEATVISLRYGGGHYETSVMPGEVGNCTVLAHHMRAEDSMFHNLDMVTYGDIIEFTTITGDMYQYEVDEIKVIHAYELDDNIRGDITETRQITLVTCTYTATEKMRLLVVGHLIENE